jgi:hypothetical protein|tara:strand:+ start:416 stop:526 length:111 start_codon:yes stop_codon:yes gene_type:complete
MFQKKEYDWMLQPISARAKKIRDVAKKIDAYRAGVR